MLRYAAEGLCLTHPLKEPIIITSTDGDFKRPKIKKVSEGEANNLPVLKNFEIVFGIFRLVSGPYLCVVTKHQLVCSSPNDKPIFLIDEIHLRPVFGENQVNALNEARRKEEREFIRSIHQLFSQKSFYYCEGYDITHTTQFLAEQKEQKDSKTNEALWHHAEEKFFWNRHLVDDFAADPSLHPWIVPVISGFVFRATTQIGDDVFRILFISRRSCKRQGTRYTVRGIDEKGNVANFVETEQIVIRKDGSITSYVQVRGSVPLFWKQVPTLKYTPKIEFTGDRQQNVQAAYLHFKDLQSTYGDIVVINLIDKKKQELILGTALGETIEALQSHKPRYVWFDFHSECKKMKFQNLSKLLEAVKTDFESHGFFSADKSGKILSKQKGVMRTNCIDNLDRTNVVQSLFARQGILAQFQLTSSNILNTPFEEFELVFKNAWADNADRLSLLYSGTGALKTDFTRTGKRTIQGALRDGANSLTRYYLNNFCDGKKQDSIDVALGYYKIDSNTPSPLAEFPSLFSAESPFFIIRLLLIILTMLIAILSCAIKKWKGRKFANKPRLNSAEYDRDSVDIAKVLSSEAIEKIKSLNSKAKDKHS